MATDHLSLMYCIIAIRGPAKDAVADKHDRQVSESNPVHYLQKHAALFTPETAISCQKRHPYPGSLNSGTPGDSKNAFFHWGDVLGHTCNLQTSKDERGTCHIHGGSVLIIEEGHGPLHEGKGTKALLVAGCL